MNTSAHAQTLLAPLLGGRLAADLAGAGVLALRLRAGHVVQGEAALLDGSCRDVLLRRRSGREQEQGPHVFDAFGQPWLPWTIPTAASGLPEDETSMFHR